MDMSGRIGVRGHSSRLYARSQVSDHRLKKIIQSHSATDLHSFSTLYNHLLKAFWTTLSHKHNVYTNG